MKPVIDVVDAFERRLRNTWHLSIAGDTSSWPYRHPLGRPDSQTMLRDFGTVQRWVFDLDEWATGHGLNLEWERRRSGSTSQPLPTHVVVPDADTAARVVGQGWTQRLARGRARFGVLAAEFPDATLPRVVREVDDWSQVDFGLLVVAAHWFQRNPASGRSPRQVPIEGLHSKWLNTHRPQVATLAGVEDLGLVEPRTTPIAFTYLDRMHRESGGRLHDSVIPGDLVRPAYTPRLAVIAENKDTAILFPEVAGAIAVQGGGKAGPALISQIGWMRGADRVVYWATWTRTGSKSSTATGPPGHRSTRS